MFSHHGAIDEDDSNYDASGEVSDDEADFLFAVNQRNRNNSEIELLINEGANVDVFDGHGNTALHLAAVDSDIDLIRMLLLEGDADIFIKNNKHETPLHLAVKTGNLEGVRCLIDLGTKSKKYPHGDPALCAAALAKRNADRDTPLHLAALRGDLAIVKYLLRKGAVVTSRNSDAATALELAIFNGHIEVVAYLLTKGGNKINETDIDGHTLLHQAAMHGKSHLIKWLLSQDGVNVFEVNERWETALWLAMREKKPRTIETLLHLGAGIKTDLSGLDLSSLAIKHCILIGATVDGKPLQTEAAITSMSQLHDAMLRGVVFNFSAIRMAVALRLKEYPQDEELLALRNSLRAVHLDLKLYGISPSPSSVPQPSNDLTGPSITCKRA
jgi:ankyrin repeat protein